MIIGQDAMSLSLHCLGMKAQEMSCLIAWESHACTCECALRFLPKGVKPNPWRQHHLLRVLSSIINFKCEGWRQPSVRLGVCFWVTASVAHVHAWTCVCTYVFGYQSRPKDCRIHWSCSYRELSHLNWVLRSKHGSCGRAAGAPIAKPALQPLCV